MAKMLQVGVIGYRNANGEVYKTEPILQESTPELEEGYEIFIQSLAKFFIDYFALAEKSKKEVANEISLSKVE